jgi:hypothetical protein
VRARPLIASVDEIKHRRKENPMRKLIVLGLLAGLAALAGVSMMPAAAKVPGPNGRIAFARVDPAVGGTVTYTANPDGSHVKQLFSGGPSGAPAGLRTAARSPSSPPARTAKRTAH